MTGTHLSCLNFDCHDNPVQICGVHGLIRGLVDWRTDLFTRKESDFLVTERVSLRRTVALYLGKSWKSASWISLTKHLLPSIQRIQRFWTPNFKMKWNEKRQKKKQKTKHHPLRKNIISGRQLPWAFLHQYRSGRRQLQTRIQREAIYVLYRCRDEDDARWPFPSRGSPIKHSIPLTSVPLILAIVAQMASACRLVGTSVH